MQYIHGKQVSKQHTVYLAFRMTVLALGLAGLWSLTAAPSYAAYSDESMLLAKNYQHQTPKFDYLHLTREANLNATTAQKTDYQVFREGVGAYFQESYTDAVNLFLPLAERGHSSSQFYVALMYDQGHGVIQNQSIATQWYLKAAQQGHIDAQYNLGIAYASGQGVEQSILQAIHWWQKAASDGSVDAQYNLGMVYTTGKGIEADAKLAVKWWRKAAHNGDAAAQFNLGVVYVNGGKGVRSNVCEASRLWKLSAEQGFDRAVSALRILKSMDRYHASSCFNVTAKSE